MLKGNAARYRMAFAVDTNWYCRQDEGEARDMLASLVDDAVKDGQGREELLDTVLSTFVSRLASQAKVDASESRSSARTGMAAAYRLARRIAMVNPLPPPASPPAPTPTPPFLLLLPAETRGVDVACHVG